MGFHSIDVPYPWDALEPVRARAALHPGGLVDLSIGTPVDSTPALVQRALAAASDAHGYPTVAGPLALRQAVVDWFARRRGVSLTPDAVLPTIGSKELVGLLPSQLGLGPGDTVVVPTRAYPTYEVGSRLAGANVVASDNPSEWSGRRDVRLVWVNSPSNPTGEVLGTEQLAAVVRAAREVGAVVASDECYAMLAWERPWRDEGVPSLLDPRVTGGDLTGLLAVYSLSKQSSMAGYRASFVAGDHRLIAQLLLQRRHLGMMPPAPVQAAMQVALGDDQHVLEQAERYRARRALLLPALEGAGFVREHSEAGLYLWVRAGKRLAARLGTLDDDAAVPSASASPREREGKAASCWALLDHLASYGILAGPGEFYGSAAAAYVRVSLTASDERIAAAAGRLALASL